MRRYFVVLKDNKEMDNEIVLMSTALSRVNKGNSRCKTRRYSMQEVVIKDGKLYKKD